MECEDLPEVKAECTVMVTTGQMAHSEIGRWTVIGWAGLPECDDGKSVKRSAVWRRLELRLAIRHGESCDGGRGYHVKLRELLGGSTDGCFLGWGFFSACKEIMTRKEYKAHFKIDMWGGNRWCELGEDMDGMFTHGAPEGKTPTGSDWEDFRCGLNKATAVTLLALGDTVAAGEELKEQRLRFLGGGLRKARAAEFVYRGKGKISESEEAWREAGSLWKDKSIPELRPGVSEKVEIADRKGKSMGVKGTVFREK